MALSAIASVALAAEKDFVPYLEVISRPTDWLCVCCVCWVAVRDDTFIFIDTTEFS